MTRNEVLGLLLLAGVALLSAAGFVWSGIYDVGADDRHTRAVYALLETMRQRSIQVRADDLRVPELKDPARIAQGAGNYDAMCAGCHLKPGTAETELSKGLYPAPPDLTERTVDAAEAFWVVKHGIKASGMPAWGKSMHDEYIWNMVAFVQALPGLDAARYQALVAASGGHSHGGGETGAHDHGEAMLHDRAGMDMGGARGDAPGSHSHPPGTPPHDDAPGNGPRPHAPMPPRAGPRANDRAPPEAPSGSAEDEDHHHAH